jgi:hypothetical protein
VHWTVDGRAVGSPRWTLAVGPHLVVAARRGERDSVRIDVRP